jgi:hypothetical protein
MTPTERRILAAAEDWYDSHGNAEAELAAAVAEGRRENRAPVSEPVQEVLP